MRLAHRVSYIMHLLLNECSESVVELLLVGSMAGL